MFPLKHNSNGSCQLEWRFTTGHTILIRLWPLVRAGVAGKPSKRPCCTTWTFSRNSAQEKRTWQSEYANAEQSMNQGHQCSFSEVPKQCRGAMLRMSACCVISAYKSVQVSPHPSPSLALTHTASALAPCISLLSLAHSCPAEVDILSHIPESWGSLAQLLESQHQNTLICILNDRIKIPVCFVWWKRCREVKFHGNNYTSSERHDLAKQIGIIIKATLLVLLEELKMCVYFLQIYLKDITKTNFTKKKKTTEQPRQSAYRTPATRVGRVKYQQKPGLGDRVKLEWGNASTHTDTNMAHVVNLFEAQLQNAWKASLCPLGKRLDNSPHGKLNIKGKPAPTPCTFKVLPMEKNGRPARSPLEKPSS